MNNIPPCLPLRHFSSNVHSEWGHETPNLPCLDVPEKQSISNNNDTSLTYTATSDKIMANNSFVIRPSPISSISFLQDLQFRFLSWFALGHWKVKILTHALTAMQAPVTLLAVPCPTNSIFSAGYSPPHHTIWLCANRLWNPFEFRRALVHELIHAFDFTRAKLSPVNCDHVACTEIRAYHLSNQCGFISTFGASSTLDFKPDENLSNMLSKRDQCITYNTLLSLSDHPHCKKSSKQDLLYTINKVYSRCIQDYWPFMGPSDKDSSWRPSHVINNSL